MCSVIIGEADFKQHREDNKFNNNVYFVVAIFVGGLSDSKLLDFSAFHIYLKHAQNERETQQSVYLNIL